MLCAVWVCAGPTPFTHPVPVPSELLFAVMLARGRTCDPLDLAVRTAGPVANAVLVAVATLVLLVAFSGRPPSDCATYVRG